MTTQLTLFDYDTLDSETRVSLRQRAERINERTRNIARDIWKNGREFHEAQQELAQHGYGSFIAWAESETGYSKRTVYNYIRVYEQFDCATVAQSKISPKVLYLLAAPSTPEEARQEAIARAETGETITHSTAKQVVARHKDSTAGSGDIKECPTCHSHYDTVTFNYCPYCYKQYKGLKPGWTEGLPEMVNREHPVPAPQSPADYAPVGFVPSAEDYAAEDEEWEEPTFAPSPVSVALDEQFEEEEQTDAPYAETVDDRSAAIRAQRMAVTVYSQESVEWYTPPWVIDLARTAMGGIDLDPASNPVANEWIKALTIYTADDDGYSRPWHGRVWLNPPYGRDEESNQYNTIRWSQKLIYEWTAGHITAAILLVKAAMGYNWFEELWYTYPTCFLRERLSFIRPGRDEKGQSKQGTALVYFGNDLAAFQTTYRPYGRVILPEVTP